MRISYSMLPLIGVLAACTSSPAEQKPMEQKPVEGTASVPAVGQTAAVATTDADAADDPAIWVDKADPARSLIVATDKKAGLNVYALDGTLKSSYPAGHVNNIDLRVVGERIIVVASDRNDKKLGKLALFELDAATAKLKPLGVLPVGAGEGYGVCMGQVEVGRVDAFLVMKEGDIFQVELALDGKPKATVVRRMKLATQSEGCVVDDRTGTLYVAEEDVGIWRFGARKSDAVKPVAVAKADGKHLVIDVEGLAIAAEGTQGGYLVASSQGDNAYALWRLSDLSYAGRFRIAAAGGIGGTSETDGIEVTTASLPGYEAGIMIAQDGDNMPAAQNFKMIRWADVKRALKLP